MFGAPCVLAPVEIMTAPQRGACLGPSSGVEQPWPGACPQSGGECLGSLFTLPVGQEGTKGVALDGDVLFAHNATVGPVALFSVRLQRKGARVTLVAPKATRLEVARAYAASKLGWIRERQAKLRSQARETPRQFVERESHYLWGRRYLLSLVEKDEKPSVQLGHHKVTLTVRPGSSKAKRQAVMH